MDYSEVIQKSLDYIDANIKEKLTPEDLSKLANFSSFYYYRIFSKLVGMPVMQYITKRKLQYAIYDLHMGKKVLDIALDYGFETHAGFTKAFKKFFGYPPAMHRLHIICNERPQKVDLKKLKKIKTGGIIMDVKIIDKEAFKIVGYELKTSLNDNSHTRDIPAFWDKCVIDGYEANLYKTQNPSKHGEYGICVNVSDNEEGAFSYILGVETPNFDKAEDEMFTLEVPAAKYAVFTTPLVELDGFVDSIQGTWKFILEDWFPHSKYEIDDTKLDFEFYDERCHPWEYKKVCMEIYIPIK